MMTCGGGGGGGGRCRYGWCKVMAAGILRFTIVVFVIKLCIGSAKVTFYLIIVTVILHNFVKFYCV